MTEMAWPVVAAALFEVLCQYANINTSIYEENSTTISNV